MTTAEQKAEEYVDKYYGRQFTDAPADYEQCFIAGWEAREKEEEWISVEDRLPEDYEIIILYVPGFAHPFVFAFKDDNPRWTIFYNHGTGNRIDATATHWRKLPQPPTK